MRGRCFAFVFMPRHEGLCINLLRIVIGTGCRKFSEQVIICFESFPRSGLTPLRRRVSSLTLSSAVTGPSPQFGRRSCDSPGSTTARPIFRTLTLSSASWQRME